MTQPNSPKRASSSKLEGMLRVNREQSAFYESGARQRGNALTRAWRHLRGGQVRFRSAIGVDRDIYDLHRRWLGDLAGRKVLDLGCFAGNPLSLEIAAAADSYIGIDLSRTAIERLRGRLAERGLDRARAEAVDFLSPEFVETDFDVVYAHSVVHHFEHLEVLLDTLARRMKPGGIVVSVDPLNTSRPVRFARWLYRPFQSDSAWEWPFTRSTVERIAHRFDIVGVQGMMGNAKWALPLVPVSPRGAARLGAVLHARDLRRANKIHSALWGCMQVTMCWRRR